MKKILFKLKTFLLTTLLLVNVVVAPLSVSAETVLPASPEPPTAPIAPVAPEAPTAPSAPLAPEPPTAPIAPVAPEAPTAPTSTTQQTSQTGGSTSTTTGTNSTNSGNGADSNNTSDSQTNDVVDVENENNADVNNNLIVDVNSGDNEAEDNMGDGVINSGDANVSGSLVNDINNNVVNLGDLCDCNGGASANNSGNGSGSDNSANSSNNSTVDLDNINNLHLVNNEDIGANSGSNEANDNMGDGVIVSGDADISFTTINFGNNNLIDAEVVNFDVLDTRTEDLLITFPVGSDGSGSGTNSTNSGNGSDSTNNATSTTNSSTDIDNENNLILDNNVTFYANSGGNQADDNMGSGDITTGDANIASNIINFLNNNIVAGAEWLLSTVNIYGDMSGDIVLPREVDFGDCGCASDQTAANIGNGSGSTNTTTSSSTDETVINNANDAVINTNISLDANTGGNETNDNMGDSSITTGNVDVNSNLVTVANTNTVGQGDTWWLVLVNNQGEWTGKIVGANEGDTIAGSGLEFGVGPDGNIYALNSGNGSDSENSANASSNTSTTINNTNNAQVNNNINIIANTGDNQASGNMGGANIKTGDINVASNIVNFINNNFVGKRFVITVVNIFGKFSGDIVPPDQQQEAKGGPVGLNLPSVNLSNDTTISNKANIKNSRSNNLGSSFASAGESLSNALQEGGKLLENAAVSQGKVSDPVKKVINSDQKSSFQFNYLFIGVALLVLAAYAFYLRRKAVVK